jgi:hypothetical protein
MGKPILPLLLEVAAASLMLYSSLNPDINLAAAFWLMVMKVSQGLAHVAGRVGMKAELRYFLHVQA